jgi:hypothetical protein
MRIASQRGKGNIGCIFGLLVLALGVIVALKVAPVKVAVADLEAFCERQAEGASLPRNSDEAIANAILAKAKSLELPLKGEDLKVWRDGSNVHIEYKYRVVLELPFYTYDWDVQNKIERVLF